MKNKGFTLIELLAVIVVLAVIALIAVPTVLNIIEKAREGAAKSSAISYVKATETYIVTSKLDNKMEQLQAGQTYSTSKLNNLVELKGTKPTDGNVVISNKNSVASAKLVIDGYTIIYDGENYTIQGKEDTPVTPPDPELEENLLSDVAQVGDYVAYDAGEWTETVAKPTSHGNFGGYTSGQNKANSVPWCADSNYTAELKGWRVLSKNNTTITLVHAGHPECYYYQSYQSSPEDSINKLNVRAIEQYLNTTYAESAHMMTYDEAFAITGDIKETTNDLRYIGKKGTTSNNSYYWLTTVFSPVPSSLWYVNYLGDLRGMDSTSFGVRPVVVLKDGIKTTGKGTDAVGQEAWTLVAP